MKAQRAKENPGEIYIAKKMALLNVDFRSDIYSVIHLNLRMKSQYKNEVSKAIMSSDLEKLNAMCIETDWS